MRTLLLALCMYSVSLGAYTHNPSNNQTSQTGAPAPVVMTQNSGNVGQQPQETTVIVRPFAVIARTIIESILYCQRY